MKNSQIASWPDLSQPFFSLSNSLWALVPLEAWRRGLSVTLRPDARYTISDGLTEHTFWQTRLTGQRHDQLAHMLDDKHATRELLLEAGLPAPKGHSFRGEIDQRAVQDYADSLGYPVCLKPNAWAKGRGVYPRLETREELASALRTLVGDLGCDDLVVEQHISGDALRLLVVGGKLIAATRAEPANVVGDGTSTISELIEAKREIRRGNPHLRNHSLAVDADTERILGTVGLSPSSVPAEGQSVYLREAANLAQGGDSWDVTDVLPAEIVQVAVDAVDAIPGLQHAGVDLLVEDHTRADSAVFINEINPSAGLGGHLYPADGEQRSAPTAIVEHYFPGTRRRAGSDRWYFPLNTVSRVLASRSAAAVEVPPMPEMSTPTWLTLRVKVPARSLVKLRSSLFGKLNRTAAHAEIERIDGDHFDVALAGDENDVLNASRLIRREAQALNGTAKMASRAARPAAVGVRMA